MRCCRRIEAHSLNADNQSGCTAIPNPRVESEAYVTRGEAIAKKEIIRKPRERRCRKLAKRMKRSEGSLRQKALALGSVSVIKARAQPHAQRTRSPVKSPRYNASRRNASRWGNDDFGMSNGTEDRVADHCR
jgi:hypothetical protein